MSTSQTSELKTVSPSYFANLGKPCCSKWGKSEIEWLALAYVQALSNDGDTWKKLSRQQVYELLSEGQRQLPLHAMLTMDFEPYKRWFEAVSDQLTDSMGAFHVGGFWNIHHG